MYIPKHFSEQDLTQLQAVMQAYNFGLLITTQDGAPVANHLPFVLDEKRGQCGTLTAHMARANTQWHTFAEGQEALIVFQGPHTYVSPSWYEATLSVPTWNYTAVHAYGQPRVIEDPQQVYQSINALIKQSEAYYEKQWQISLLPDDYVYKLMRGVVCFEIEITRLEGKFKLSQNRPVSDQGRVVERLRESSDPLKVDVANLMDERLNR